MINSRREFKSPLGHHALGALPPLQPTAGVLRREAVTGRDRSRPPSPPRRPSTGKSVPQMSRRSLPVAQSRTQQRRERVMGPRRRASGSQIPRPAGSPTRRDRVECTRAPLHRPPSPWVRHHQRPRNCRVSFSRTAACLPSRSARRVGHSIVSSDVAGPRTISTHRMTRAEVQKHDVPATQPPKVPSCPGSAAARRAGVTPDAGPQLAGRRRGSQLRRPCAWWIRALGILPV